MKFNFIAGGCVVAMIIVSCGPSAPTSDERQYLQEKEKEESRTSLDAELDAFAKRHGAVHVEIFAYDNKFSGKFTAAIQQDVEGKLIVFRASLLDVIRTRSGQYEGIFGNWLLSASTANLSISPDIAAQMLEHDSDYYDEVVVAARIEQVVRNQLSARVCEVPECNSVSIEVESFFPSFQLWGDLVDLYLQETRP